MLARIGTWLDDRLRASVLIAAVQSALRNDPAAAAQAWRDLSWHSLLLWRLGLHGAVRSSMDADLHSRNDLDSSAARARSGLWRSLVLFGLALLNEMVTRAPIARSSAAGSRASTGSNPSCATSRPSAPWECCPGWRASCMTSNCTRRRRSSPRPRVPPPSRPWPASSGSSPRSLSWPAPPGS